MVQNRSAAGAMLAIVLLASACGPPPEGAPTVTAGTPIAAPTGGPAAPAGVAAPPAGATIRGVVSYAGRDPDVPLPIGGDPFCVGDQFSETVSGDGAGHLGNVVVYVKAGPIGGAYPVPAQPALLDQRGCQYHPHVQAIRAGQKLRILNTDATLHNVLVQAEANRSFNVGQPFAGMELFKTFERQEVAIPFRCSVHPWMLAWVAVLEHPFFAVSGDDGSFSIAGLPPGTYTLEAWHETLGTRSAEATVGDGGSAELSFQFDPAGK